MDIKLGSEFSLLDLFGKVRWEGEEHHISAILLSDLKIDFFSIIPQQIQLILEHKEMDKL